MHMYKYETYLCLLACLLAFKLQPLVYSVSLFSPMFFIKNIALCTFLRYSNRRMKYFSIMEDVMAVSMSKVTVKIITTWDLCGFPNACHQPGLILNPTFWLPYTEVNPKYRARIKP